ncbi:MAG: hypothetical protein J6C41_07860 [Oscillospiraceae bacterium]|nr:hypothetical protein [Oscillospiraceae bacterium]
MLFKKFRALKKSDPEKEQELRDTIEKEGGLEKNDVKAMIIAATLVFLPVVAGILLILCLVLYLL